VQPEVPEPHYAARSEKVYYAFCNVPVTRYASAPDAESVVTNFFNALRQEKDGPVPAHGAIAQAASEKVFWIGEFQER